MDKETRKLMWWVLLVFALGWGHGCATVHGIAKDTKALASYVERHTEDPNR